MFYKFHISNDVGRFTEEEKKKKEAGMEYGPLHSSATYMTYRRKSRAPASWIAIILRHIFLNKIRVCFQIKNGDTVGR